MMLGLKAAGVAVLGVLGGFLLGIVVSEVIAIGGYVVSGEDLPSGFRVLRFLPWALAAVGAVAAPVVFWRTRGR